MGILVFMPHAVLGPPLPFLSPFPGQEQLLLCAIDVVLYRLALVSIALIVQEE